MSKEPERKRRVISPEVPEQPPQRWSNCFRVGDIVYVAGMTARADDGETVTGNAYEQAAQIFGKIRTLVEAAGGAVDDVVKITIYVTDIEFRADVWRARAECFSGDFPTSTLVEVSALAKPEMLVEVEAIAHVGCSGG